MIDGCDFVKGVFSFLVFLLLGEREKRGDRERTERSMCCLVSSRSLLRALARFIGCLLERKIDRLMISSHCFLFFGSERGDCGVVVKTP